jgi:hypothetical protein
MAEAEIERLKAVLRWRFTRFMNRSLARHDAYQSAIGRMLRRGETLALFGGALRDLMSRGDAAEPRDLDLVVGSSDTRHVFEVLGGEKVNRFGGQRVELTGRQIDVWPLSKTWAFRALGTGKGGFEDLARTTFLNVEAIAVMLSRSAHWRPWAWDDRFFRAFLDHLVEINLEENPNPLGCVARSLVSASRLRFALGPRLVAYIGYYSRKIAPEELVDFQKSHYGGVIFSAPKIAFMKSVIYSHLRTRRSSPLRLFVTHKWQREEMCEGLAPSSGSQRAMNVGWKNLVDLPTLTAPAPLPAGPPAS